MAIQVSGRNATVVTAVLVSFLLIACGPSLVKLTRSSMKEHYLNNSNIKNIQVYYRASKRGLPGKTTFVWKKVEKDTMVSNVKTSEVKESEHSDIRTVTLKNNTPGGIMKITGNILRVNFGQDIVLDFKISQDDITLVTDRITMDGLVYKREEKPGWLAFEAHKVKVVTTEKENKDIDGYIVE